MKELHLFAGIGGGIYGGKLLGHTIVGGVEIDEYCQSVLKQRQNDGWLEPFPIYSDLTKLDGTPFKGTFDVLCGGFPCQAFSHAAHGKNIAEKNLWKEMLRFVKESDAPIVFGENVTEKAIRMACDDLNANGYITKYIKLSVGDIGGDHRRDRFWCLAIKSESYDELLKTLVDDISEKPIIHTRCWTTPCVENSEYDNIQRRQLKGIGNAQSPLVVATAFRYLVLNHSKTTKKHTISSKDVSEYVHTYPTFIQMTHGKDYGYVHTPTTMANYSCPSMMKHTGCRKFKEIFGTPTPRNAEYLMGFPMNASTDKPVPYHFYEKWLKIATTN